MKNKIKLFTAAAASLALAQASQAADLTWDTTIAADGVITDGAGTWTTGAGNWNDTPVTPTSDGIVWADGDKAIFGGGTEGTAGTVTLGSDITTTAAVEAITFNTAFAGTYTLDTASFILTTGGVRVNAGSGAVLIESSDGGSLALNATNTWSITNGPLTVTSQITGAFGINKFGAGHMYLSNDNNSFTGVLNLNNGGNTYVSSIANSGVNSAAGAGDTIQIGNNADLFYTGSGDSTDRTLTVYNAGSTIYNNGTGALVFTGAFANTTANTATKTLTLRGSNTDTNEIQGAIIDSTVNSNPLNLTKTDDGTWKVSGDNTYTGTTNVTGGTLIAGSTSAFGSNSAVTVNNATLLQLDGNSNSIGSLAGAGTVENANAAAVVLSTGEDDTSTSFSGVIQDGAGGGALALTKLGTGVQTLSGANTYTGATTISEGTLQLGDGGTTGSLSTSSAITNNGTLAFNRSNTVTQGTDFSGSALTSGALEQNGSGTLVLNAANTYTGATTISAGTLQLGDGGTTGSLSTSSAITNAGTLAFNRSNTVTQGTDFSGSALTGIGGITQNGSGTLVLNQANTYTGTTTLAAGVLQADIADIAATSGALGNGGDITFTGGTLQYTANSAGTDYSSRITGSSAMSFDTNGQDVVLASSLLGNTGLTKLGAGQLTAQWDLSYNGITTVDEGTLVLVSSSESNKNSNSTGFQINNGSTLKIEKGVSGLSIDTDTFTFDSAGGGTLEVNGSQGLWRNNTVVTTGGLQNTLAGTAYLNMQNTRTAYYDIADGSDDFDLLVSVDHERGFIVKRGTGTLALTHIHNDLLDTNTITIEDGVFEVADAGRIKRGNFGGAVINDGVYRQNSTADQTLFGVVSGTGAIEQTGTGTLTLSGVNTYTGSTTVSAGTLVVADGGSINATSGITVSSAGTFDYNSSTALAAAISFTGTGNTLTGSGTIGTAVTITDGNILSVGNSPGTMNFAAGLALDAGSSTIAEIDGTAGAGVAGGHDFHNVTGALVYGGDLNLVLGSGILADGAYSWDLFDFGTETGTFASIALSGDYTGNLLDGDTDGIWDLVDGDNTWVFTETTGILGLTVVPEPNAYALLAGIFGLTFVMLRRRRA
ncbi:autotransporter-associated beta strand repeat-containing protein [Lentimonas sp. CC11]|uniref:beta strand repeat-containing protein n=2 Tax=Lentimonas TaxID=417293 RepID=UPI001352718A|nr:autotransporter-associated beta strand repeat-containing protein [Lentimonas sp. CC11]CAA7072346.1 Unannotated [Lentimonas sp. CC11]